MRINVGYTINSLNFGENAANRRILQNTLEVDWKNTLLRIDTAEISPEGKAKAALLNNERIQNMNIIENSGNGFNKPTMYAELMGVYNRYWNEAFEKELAPSEDVYDHIINAHVDSLSRAYQDVYNEIVQGYKDGTREIWTQDFEEGADYVEFEMDGKTWQFHKLTMEEELDRLDKAYEKASEHVDAYANMMIDTQRMIDRVMPEHQEKLRQIAQQKARMMGIDTEKDQEIEAQRIKEKVMRAKKGDETEKVNIYEMLMAARKQWLEQLD